MVNLVSGVIESFAGSCGGDAGDAIGAATDARFSSPTDLALDEQTGQLFVADTDNHAIKVVDLSTGDVERFAGTGTASCSSPYGPEVPAFCEEQHAGGDGGPAIAATLYRPFGIALDLVGNLIITDTYDHRFRIVYRQ